MGKKMKKKAPNPRKIQHRAASAGSQKLVLQDSGGDGDSDSKACKHYTKGTVELNRVLVKIRSSSRDVVACENCREERVNGGKGKERGKQPKRKGSGTRVSESKSNANLLWVCLDCGRYFCGGGVSMLEPYGHARRHAKQEHHHWAVQADDPLISWCYSCSSSVPIEMPEEVIEVENEAAMNDRSWSLRGIANEPLDSEKLKGHKVRGLLNLGNTCFFNSVMQNFFSLDPLRKYLICLERPAGPLFTALRTLVVETTRGADSKGVISPKALFGCICAKAPQFRGYQQQDSHELLRYLLDGLHVEETNARKASGLSDNGEKINTKTKATIVDAIFSGQLSSTVSCMECHNTSVVNEPFLDLSLPVPSKKHSSKRVPPSSPKKINQRDKNKSLQFRSKGLTRVSTESVNLSAESTEKPSECSESGTAVPLPINDNAMEAGDFTWMDYIGAETTICNDSSALDLETSKQVKEINSIEHYDHEVHEDAESTAQCVSEFNASCSNNLTVSLDAFAECSCKDEVPQSCASISDVILLPYKEQEQEKEQEQYWTSLDRNSFSQVPDNTNIIDISLSVSCTAKFSCNQAEEEFDGFGDLFNEPEATSYLNTETNAEEDTDITLWIQNIQESSLEELDDTNTLVSINSCLALFTKPEILSDEQAWYCEHCSKMLKKTREHEVSKLQATNLHVTVRPKMDEDEIPSKKDVASFHEDSASTKVLDNWRINAFQKLASQAEYSLNNGDSNRNDTLETAFCTNMTSCPDVLDRDMSESETSQYFSTSTCVNSRAQDCSTNEESNFHGINDHSIENDGKKTEFDSHYLRSHTNKCVHMPCEDRSQAVNRVRKKGIKPDNAYPDRDNKGEGIKMVKRVATKRILINRVPPILTIHLKRFSQDTRGHLTKLSGHVSFQETLDLKSYMDPRCIEDRTLYHLTGVIEHMGSMGGGHYVSYTRGEGRGDSSSSSSCCTGQSWFYASDAYVKEVSLAEVLRSEAYILFYEKM